MSDTAGFGMVPRYLQGELTTYEVAVYVALSWYTDGVRGECWPSIRTIGQSVGASEASVKRALKGLQAKGWVTIHARFSPAGDPTSNLYRLQLRNEGGVLGDGGRGPQEPREGSSGPTNKKYLNKNHKNSRSAEPTDSVQMGIDEQVTVLPGPDPFDAFWKEYPRKVAKPKAREAYARSIKSGVKPALILAALRAQLPELSSRDPKFIPHPATWLNGGQWANETGPTGPAPATKGLSWDYQ